MGFAAAPFIPAIQKVTDQIFVQPVLATELSNGRALTVKHRASLLGG